MNYAFCVFVSCVSVVVLADSHSKDKSTVPILKNPQSRNKTKQNMLISHKVTENRNARGAHRERETELDWAL